MTISECDPEASQQGADVTPGCAPSEKALASASVEERQKPAVQVLLVDDNASVRDTASAYLKAAGYSVTLASNGFDGLARVVQTRPDVVLADITMPKMDGYQMCALMKSNSDYRHIPVIMITGKDGLLDQTRASLVGSDAHVSKPFTAQALTEAVSEADHSQEVSEG